MESAVHTGALQGERKRRAAIRTSLTGMKEKAGRSSDFFLGELEKDCL
jgi:hypothetical protein